MNLSVLQPKELKGREDLQYVVTDVTAATAFHFIIIGFVNGLVSVTELVIASNDLL